MSLAACLLPLYGEAPAMRRKHSRSSSSAVAQSRITVANISPGVSMLAFTPVEVVVELFKSLDLRTAFNLAATDRRLAAIFATHRTTILLPILMVEYSPFDELLQVVKSSPADLRRPFGTFLSKRVRRRKEVLCNGGLAAGCSTAHLWGLQPEDTVLEDSEMERLLAVCKVVSGWIRVFPQHRFSSCPSSTRSLQPWENERLRRALYTWMRYAYYFHGNLPRPNIYVPIGNDVRVNYLRTLPNSELRELRDLWLTVQDIVELKLCPSADRVRLELEGEMPDKVASRLGWGEQRENQLIVATVCKLSPEELLHYLDNIHAYPKQRLVRDIRQRYPCFDFDTESLSSALAYVGFERCRQARAEFPSSNPIGAAMCLPMYSRDLGEAGGGILDWDNQEAEAEFTKVGEMAGLGLDWYTEEPLVHLRPELPSGLLETHHHREVIL